MWSNEDVIDYQKACSKYSFKKIEQLTPVPVIRSYASTEHQCQGENNSCLTQCCFYFSTVSREGVPSSLQSVHLLLIMQSLQLNNSVDVSQLESIDRLMIIWLFVQSPRVYEFRIENRLATVNDFTQSIWSSISHKNTYQKENKLYIWLTLFASLRVWLRPLSSCIWDVFLSRSDSSNLTEAAVFSAASKDSASVQFFLRNSYNIIYHHGTWQRKYNMHINRSLVIDVKI